jgi:DHA3 family macrolide efflux protein-like MFS transporter
MNNNIENNNQWKKVFYTVSFGQAFSIIGSSVVQFAIMWYLTVKTNSAIVLSISAIVGLLPQAILGPFIGTIIDKYNRKNIMMISDSIVALATLTLSISFINNIESVNLVYFVLFIRSVGSSFHSSSMQASIPMIVPLEKLGLSASVNQFIQSGANILGPAIGALSIISNRRLIKIILCKF